MNEHRRKILDMLAAGKITADEAERLMAALETDAPSAPGASGESQTKAKPKYLRVLVESEGDGEDHAVKVNTRVPMQLLRAGVKLASLIPAQARRHVNAAFREHGLPFDLTQIKPENLEELVEQLDDLTVDVDANGAGQKKNQVKVRVFCE